MSRVDSGIIISQEDLSGGWSTLRALTPEAKLVIDTLLPKENVIRVGNLTATSTAKANEVTQLLDEVATVLK